MSEVTGGADASASSAPESQSVNEYTESTNTETQSSEAKPTESQKQAMMKKFKLKVDGEEFEKEIDLNDESALAKELQLSHAAKKRMEEAVATKRKAAELIKQLDDPEAILRKLGPKGLEIAEKFLFEKLKMDSMTDQERKYYEMEMKIKDIEEREAKQREMIEKTEAEKKESEIGQKLQSTIIEAIEKTGLPKSPELVKRMAALYKKNLQYGLELSPDDLAQEVKGEVSGFVQSIAKDADAEKLVALIGEDGVKKIQKYAIYKLKEKQQAQFARANGQDSAPKRKESRPLSIDEWKEQIEKRLQS